MPRISTLGHVITRSLVMFADTPDEAIHLLYRPGAFNSNAMEEWNAIAAQANAATTEGEQEHAALDFGALFCRIIHSWDLTEDDGATLFPLTPERIVAEFERQPIVWPAFLQSTIQAIAEDMKAGNANGTASPAPSDATSSKADSSTSSPARSSRKRSA